MVNKSWTQATLCFPIKDSKVLLGMKLRGFGEGKWNGFGGKILPQENHEAAAARELKEECGISSKQLEKVGVVKFDWPDNPDWNKEVHIYLVNNWKGKPIKSEEMKPKWFEFNKVPYEKMWWDDIHWLPRVLKGEKLSATFWMSDNEKDRRFEIKSN